jgi:BirA family biotin operon repressor/biotin-[acetyl-CoA-carboxylase] ligase
MKLIKLDAVGSTNDFLKELASDPTIENFTIVTAENQTSGRGQRGERWETEVGKNIIASVLIKNIQIGKQNLFELNIKVALSVFSALDNFNIPNLSIKWPNDIMSGRKKIGGILIENILKSDGKMVSIVGIGLNVNQVNFEHLPKASSLAIINGTKYDKELILFEIIDNLMIFISELHQNRVDDLWKKYNSVLFARNIPMPFKNIVGFQFMGIIQDVSPNGKLRVLLADDSIKEFDVKEIEMLY